MEGGLILVCVTLPVGVCSVALCWLLWRVEQQRRALRATLVELKDVGRGGDLRSKPATDHERLEVGLALSPQPSSPCSLRGVPRSSGGQHHRPCDADTTSTPVQQQQHGRPASRKCSSRPLAEEHHAAVVAMLRAEHVSREDSSEQAAAWPSTGPQMLLPAATLPPPSPLSPEPLPPRASRSFQRPSAHERASSIALASSPAPVSAPSPKTPPPLSSQLAAAARLTPHGSQHKLAVDAALQAAIMTKAMLMPDEVLHHATAAREHWHSAGRAVGACNAFRTAPMRAAAKTGVTLQRTVQLAAVAGGPSAAETLPQPPVTAAATAAAAAAALVVAGAGCCPASTRASPWWCRTERIIT